MLVALAAAAADAQPLATPPTAPAVAPAGPRAPGPRLELVATGALRVTALDGQASAFVDDALAYGWRTARARPLLGGGLAAHYLWTPIVDVGVHVGWMAQSYAAAVLDPDDRLAVRWRSAAVSARLRWAGGRPFIPEPRVDLGLADQRTTVHGTAAHRLRTVIRLGADWRLGTRRAGCELSIGYTRVGRERGDGPAPPVGGLDLAAGPYLRF